MNRTPGGRARDPHDGPAGLPAEGRLSSAPAPDGMRWPRRALALGWAAALALAGGVLVASWDDLLARLARTPRPGAQLPASSYLLPHSTEGELAIAEARQRLEAGDSEGAVRALDRVSPHEPSYPFAQRLRRQVEQAMSQEAR